MKKSIFLSIICLMTLCCACKQTSEDPQRVIGAYIFRDTNGLVDPSLVTHINFAFGHVNETFNGVYLPNTEMFKKIIDLKKQKPELKVLLSIGGWGSGRFSEMAMDEANRKSFAADCARIVKEYGIDGIDIDWEYPTIADAGISADSSDTKNFTLLMKDLRDAIGSDKLLTIATVCSAMYIDFPDILPYVDYVNVMAYDMARENLKYHHAPLYRSEIAGWMTADEAVQAHLKAGVPANKLVMGMPFYGHGDPEAYTDYGGNMEKRPQDIEVWDDVAKVPYYTDSTGHYLFGFESVRSIAEKCKYIKDQGLLGGMYWEWAEDYSDLSLAKTVYDSLK